MPMLRNFILAAVLSPFAAEASAGDWIFDNGPYTRSPTTGKRVDQYKAPPKVDRIPFQQFFSEDGPHPFGMDWWGGYGYGGYGYGWGAGMYPEYGWGMSSYGFGGYPMGGYGGPYIYPMGTP
jgi:hypothetical protein